MFWLSQSPAEQRHIVNAYRFELTRVQTPAVRERIVAGLVNIDAALAKAVADDLGIPVPPPLPRATELPIPGYPPSPSLSLLARPGTLGIKTRRIAILVADGIDGAQVRHLYASLLKDGAQPRIVGQKLGAVQTLDRCPLEVEITLEAGPSVLYDAAVLPAGSSASNKLSMDARALEFIRDQYRHGKALLALGSGTELLGAAGIPRLLPDGAEDPGLIIDGDPHEALAAFKAAVARHRVWARETDPPRV